MTYNALNLSCWETRYWETDKRLYQAEITQDIFGDWVIIRNWSGKNEKGKGHKINLCRDYAQAVSILDKIHKDRIKSGYKSL